MIREEYKLENQLCFRVHRLSRLFIKMYQPLLNRLGITYPQYLVLLVLWERGSIDYQELADRLELKTGTLTPIIQRLEKMDLVRRSKNPVDMRKTAVSLRDGGIAMKEKLEDHAEELSKLLDNLDTGRYENFAKMVDQVTDDFFRLGSYISEYESQYEK
ncbi:MarR family winged helix-turn-helix transcriptional regulator [Salinispira pacifica]|uniref:Organic hydroperoxide resistance transcriptional regulator n=1 Tax=Salinispira pacifica TaxID=1307761 RepID=V5WM43_9SPIO|nr:MarR family transcriptional regulator [Salinispira pacifica]AHC16708.1 Organic hydroperoxide resistance transcriptional regulator [Salinispira pacifica]